ncbi:hypothetical protein [Morganella morganii]|uniref:hypothetical protein n=1 Tax=Morganella morganii TaxID=582 RepID=UPI0034D4D3D6
MDRLTKSETQILIDYVKGMIQDNKEPEKKAIIALCNELEHINNLKPVGYISPVGLVNIRRSQPVLISQFNKISTIPLYRLDK